MKIRANVWIGKHVGEFVGKGTTRVTKYEEDTFILKPVGCLILFSAIIAVAFYMGVIW